MSTPLKIVSVVAIAVLAGAGFGAGAYALLDSSGGSTQVVRRQVTVTQSLQAANTTGSALTVGSIYKLTHKGVVKITVTSMGDSAQRSQGSGFVYDTNGHAVTNQHVIDGADSINVTFWNGRSFPASLVGSDPSTDTAVIKVDAPASILHPIAVGNSTGVQVGDDVVAIGSPFGLEQTVTAGIVSALHREMTSPNNFTIDDSIQTDAAINHGNSGGPLLDRRGKVIGITTQIESDSGGNEGVGFAVPSNTVREIAQKLITTGKAEHAYLGVEIGDDTGDVGAHLTRVREGTPAADAGLQTGDVIKRFAGQKIDTGDELRLAVDAKRPGDTVTVAAERDGRSVTLTVTLGTRPS
jgi:putative serine protease PepD